jgi:hypothetical protein
MKDRVDSKKGDNKPESASRLRRFLKRIYAKYKIYMRQKAANSVVFENEDERRVFEFVVKLIKNPKSDAFKYDIDYFIEKDGFKVTFNSKSLSMIAPMRSDNIALYDKAYNHLSELYLDKIYAKKLKFDKEAQATKNKILDDMFNSKVFVFTESIDQ